MIATWPAPREGGKTGEELLVSFDQQRERRVLVIPALFDEANKMRRFTAEVMRALDREGVDSFLPDLPGQNESLAPLEKQTLAGWRSAIEAACTIVRATEVLTIRAGVVLAPARPPATFYAPLAPGKQLRSMLRARVIASREQGIEEHSETLAERGRNEGLLLAGWPIGAEMFRELQAAPVPEPANSRTIVQKDIGGRGLWLRAEPGEDKDQAEALAALITAAGQEAV